MRVNRLAPGAVNTPLLRPNPNGRRREGRLAGPVGEPADIAAAIACLASDEARSINGATLVADGGRLDKL